MPARRAPSPARLLLTRRSARGSEPAGHFVLHYDDDGNPLRPLGAVDELEVERKPSSLGAAYMLDSVSVWWRSSESFRFFPCYEWLDRYESHAFTTEAFQLRKRLRMAASPKGGDGSFHVGAPPPPPKPPVLEVRKDRAKLAEQPLDGARQLLRVHEQLVLKIVDV